MNPSEHTINIRPTTSVYATFERLSYKPWFAVAELVDNSTQSYLDHREQLLATYPEDEQKAKLRVEISYDAEDNTLVVYDNAYGMEIEDFTRALVLDSPPADRSGRSEFGMGLKTAASWFGEAWTVETSRLGSARTLEATVDVTKLARDHLEVVPFKETPADPGEHFTRITIRRLRHPVRGRTAGRVLDQLGSMYREDLRSGEVEILWNGQPVRFDEPPILTERPENGDERVWKESISFEVKPPYGGASLPVHGWVGIRDPGKQRDAGFVLLRRKRVIVGGPEAGYRPGEIFGQGNTYRSQRLIGELHMDDWPVTQAKDAFDWSDGLEDAFIEQLKVASKDYANYAESYRSSRAPGPVTQERMEQASARTRQVLASEGFRRAIAEDLGTSQSSSTKREEDGPAELKTISRGLVTYTLRTGADEWLFQLHWQDQRSDAHWMQVSYPEEGKVDIFLNTAHPFFAPHLSETGMVELLQKLVVALALAEHLARRSSATDGHVTPADFRNFMNMVLKRVAEIQGVTDG